MLPLQLRLSAPLFETLVSVGNRLAVAVDPWWVIGSAAAALYGLDAASVGDVDVVTSVADARGLLAGPNAVAIDDGGKGSFRSEVFVHLTGLPMTVEILGGFSARGARLAIATRVAAPVGETLVYLPERKELVAILRLFGRPKDLARAAALAALGGAAAGTCD